MNSRLQGYLLCALAMVGVGSTVVVSKPIAAGLPPFSATALRFAIAFPLFVAILRWRRVRWPRVGWRDAGLLVAQAGAGSVGYTVCLISGMKLASAADAGVIAGTLPAVAAAVSMLLLGERPRIATLAAIALATAGVLTCTGVFEPFARATTSSHGGVALSGNLLVFAAVVCEALFILLNRKLSVPIAPLPLSALMSGIGLVVATIAALAFEHPFGAAYDPRTLGAALLGVAYYALVPTVGGFVAWYAGAARLSGTEAGLMTALVPVASIALAVVLLHEPLTRMQLAGAACVLAAVWLATRGTHSVRRQRTLPEPDERCNETV